MVQSRQNIISFFIKVMAAVYILVGVLLLVLPQLSFKVSGSVFVISGTSKIVFGVMLLVYGVYRAYMSFQKPNEARRRHYLMIVGLSMVLATTSSCKQNLAQSGYWSDNDTILVSVDETFRPILQSGYEVFTSMDTLSEMEIEYVPENVAIKNLLEGKSLLAVAARQLTKKEIAYFNSKTVYPRTTKIATDAIAVITHRSNPDSVLTLKEIRQILTGEVTTWKELEKNGANAPINVIFDNNESGIVRFMVDSICRDKKMNAKANAESINTDVVDYVATHENAIGFIGASWISDPNDTLHLTFHRKIQVVSVCASDEESYSDSYKPYQAYMLDGMYPLTRDIYMINTEPKDGKAMRFTNFMAGDKGQRIILKSGILPAVAPTRMIHVNNGY
jgi:phosphate transport system substrate-binding protein